MAKRGFINKGGHSGPPRKPKPNIKPPAQRPGNVAELCAQLAAAKAEIERLLARVKELEAALKMALGEPGDYWHDHPVKVQIRAALAERKDGVIRE